MPHLKPFYELDSDGWLLKPQANPSKAKYEPRELVRQWILRELVETYQYPYEWIGSRIILVDSQNSEFYKQNFFGLCLLTSNKQPFLWVSAAIQGEIEQAEKALISVLREDRLASLGISTDGTRKGTKFLRRRFDTDKYEYIVDLEIYSSPVITPSSQFGLLESFNSVASVQAEQKIMPLSERVENIFFDVHSYIRDIDGLHADEALDELCKVLYAKLYDEEITTSQEPLRMQKLLYGSTEEFATNIRSVYQEANEYDTRVFSLKIPGYQRSRGVFSTPIRLSSPALVKVVETLQVYNLSHSDTDIKGRAFQKVISPTIRSGMGQYFTPEPVVKFMIKMSRPQISELILDPFCGSAHFLSGCLQFVRQQNHNIYDKHLHEFAFGKLHGIEKSDRMVRIAMTDMRLQGDGHSNIRCTDALLDFSNYPDLQAESFDLILTNPPFGSLLSTEALAQLGKSFLAHGRKTSPLEVLGIERCVQFLRPGGRLGIVLPDGLMANRSASYVREWIKEQAKLRAIISLPVETFAPFGANIKTTILFIRKWRKREQKVSDYPIFIARIDNVGYDAAGRSKEESDFDPIVQEFSKFLNEEGW